MKKQPLMTAGITLALGLAAVCATARTNVVFVTIDDLSRESLGIHGCPVEQITPHLDALGYSGMYQQHNRIYSLGKEGAGNQYTFPTIPDTFRAAGFHTGIMGKNSHQSPFEPYSGWYGWDTGNGPKEETSNHPSRIYGPEEVPYPSWFPPISEAEKVGTTKNGVTNSRHRHPVRARVGIRRDVVPHHPPSLWAGPPRSNPPLDGTRVYKQPPPTTKYRV